MPAKALSHWPLAFSLSNLARGPKSRRESRKKGALKRYLVLFGYFHASSTSLGELVAGFLALRSGTLGSTCVEVLSDLCTRLHQAHLDQPHIISHASYGPRE